MRVVLTCIENWVCVLCLAVMTILAFANVVSRYVFAASFSFSEEITTYLFVLLSLMGAAVAARRGAHLGFTAILDALSPAKRRGLSIISGIMGTMYSAAICYYGFLMTLGQYGRHQVTLGMQWPEWIFGSFVPVGGLFCTIEFALFLRRQLLGDEAKEEEN